MTAGTRARWTRTLALLALLVACQAAPVWPARTSAAEGPLALACLPAEAVAAIRAAPTALPDYFQACQAELQAQLGPAFAVLAEADLLAVFATLVAHRLAPYTETDLGPLELEALLAQPALDRRGYTSLVSAFLEHLVFLDNTWLESSRLHIVGTYGGAAGQQEHLFFSRPAAGPGLLLDPALGLVALATLDGVLQGQPVAPEAIADFHVWMDLDADRAAVQSALQTGAYRPTDLLYFHENLSRAQQYDDAAYWTTAAAWRLRQSLGATAAAPRPAEAWPAAPAVAAVAAAAGGGERLTLVCVDQALLNAVRTAPESIVQHFADCEADLMLELGPAYAAADQSDLFAIFTMIVANRLAPYGANPGGKTLDALLALSFLDCVSYSQVMGFLVEFGGLPDDETQFHYVGLHGDAVGDHVQVFYTNSESGLALLLDPTIGLVAQITLDDVLSGRPVAPEAMIDFYQWDDANVEAFRGMVRAALSAGAYRPSEVWYFYETLGRYLQFVDVHTTATPGAWRWRRDYYYFLPEVCGLIAVDTVWEAGARTVTCPVVIAPGATLTITAGALVKFDPGTGLFAGGRLHIAGTAADPVTLTSSYDDAGGDTNGDGAASTPAPGDWIGLRLYAGAAGSVLEQMVVRFAGAPLGCCEPARGAVTLDAVAPSLVDSVITNSLNCGLWLWQSQPVLSGNQIFGNGACGLRNATPELRVNARWQWWGDASGPYEPKGNPAGLGDAVHGVRYEPWMTEPGLPLYTVFLPVATLN